MRLIKLVIALTLASACTAALAEDGYVTGTMNLRSGPDVSYPPVDTIPAGSPVSVQGCTDGWEWCDVIYGDDRGWVAGNYIQYEYNDQPVLLSGYGAAIGIPIVTFAVADYWGHYYRDRPFWGQRDVWFNRPYIRRAPPPAFHGAFHDYGREHGYGGNYGNHGGYNPGHNGGNHGGYDPGHNGGNYSGNHGSALVNHVQPNNVNNHPQGGHGPVQNNHVQGQPQGYHGPGGQPQLQHGQPGGNHVTPQAQQHVQQSQPYVQQHVQTQHNAPSGKDSKDDHKH